MGIDLCTLGLCVPQCMHTLHTGGLPSASTDVVLGARIRVKCGDRLDTGVSVENQEILGGPGGALTEGDIRLKSGRSDKSFQKGC